MIFLSFLRFEGLIGIAPAPPNGEAALALFGKENPQVYLGGFTFTLILLFESYIDGSTIWH